MGDGDKKRRYPPAPMPKRGRGRPRGSGQRLPTRVKPGTYDPDVLPGFTRKQSRFLREYVRDPSNVADCARRAGTTTVTAHNILNMGKTKKWLEEYRHHVTVELPAIHMESIIGLENVILNSDVRRLPFMPQEVLDMDDDTAKALSGIKITKTTRTMKDGDVLETFHVDYRFWSKDAALERANRRAGLYLKDNQQKPGATINQTNIVQNNDVTLDLSDLPDEVLEAIEKAYERKKDLRAIDVEVAG